MIKQALRMANEESPLILLRELLVRLNLHGGLWLFIIYWSRRWTGRNIVSKTVLGSRMKLNISYGGVHSELFLHGIREDKATRYFSTILKDYMTVVDIGANIGYYALQEARVCKMVYAVEPAPNNFKMLQDNINLNNYRNISTHMMAVGDRDGEVQFKLSKIPNWHKVSSNGSGDITVPLVTLDKFLNGHKVDVVRMDVEGYELNILKGMPGTLKENNLWLFIETHKDLISEYGGSIRELYELLADYDFRLVHSIILNKEGITGNIRDLLDDKSLYKGLGSWLFLKKGA